MNVLDAERLVVERTARVCHEANRAYCAAHGDNSHLPWEETPGAIRESAADGVQHALRNPFATPGEMHANWMAFKKEQGWTYGPEKDIAKKTHPCFLPYGELPAHEKAKDMIFLAIVRATMTS